MPRTRGLAFRRSEMLREGILRPFLLSGIIVGLLIATMKEITTAAGELALLCGATCALGLILWRWQLRAEDRAVIQKPGERFLLFPTPKAAGELAR